MATNLTNQAHVSYSYEGYEGTRNSDSNIVTSTRKNQVDFTVEKTSTSDCFRAGDRLTFFVKITNTGCSCLGKFEISDNLGGDGDYYTYVDGSARIFNGSMETITPTSTNPLEFEISKRLERDEELVLQYSVDVSESIPSDIDEITNEVCVRGCRCSCSSDEESRGTGSSNCVTKEASLTITKCQYAELLITKEVSNDTFCCDDELDYFITLTNTGNIDATNVVVTDYLPEDFTLMEIHKENNGVHYQYDSSEYDLDDANFLTLPNETGELIYVPAIGPGVDNTTRIRIHGHM